MLLQTRVCHCQICHPTWPNKEVLYHCRDDAKYIQNMTTCRVKVKIIFTRSWRLILNPARYEEMGHGVYFISCTEYNTKHALIVKTPGMLLDAVNRFACGNEITSLKMKVKVKVSQKIKYLNWLFCSLDIMDRLINAQREIPGLYLYHSKLPDTVTVNSLPWKQTILLKPWYVAAVKNIPAEVDETGWICKRT